MTYTLKHPRAIVGSTGSAFCVHFTVNKNTVDIVDHVKGGIGGTFTLEKAREYYKKLIKQGYVK